MDPWGVRPGSGQMVHTIGKKMGEVHGVHGNIRCIYSSYPLCAIDCLLQGKPFLQFSSLGMAPRDWQWDYFDKSDKHFGTDRTHHKAFCKACIRNAEEQLKAADAIAFSQGLLDAIQPSSQIHLEAMRHIEPICGKQEQMKTHLKSCPL